MVFYKGMTEMKKRNLLLAAAITAILSGCGGGDEDGSDNQVLPPTEDTTAVSTETPQDIILPTSEKKDVQLTARYKWALVYLLCLCWAH